MPTILGQHCFKTSFFDNLFYRALVAFIEIDSQSRRLCSRCISTRRIFFHERVVILVNYFSYTREFFDKKPPDK
ncbi:hypothetical protein DBV15_08319 [Temnothorax longispinosus]|uniref:Uncharacterized protein n=1 Tax=Temnothorax longispinosus TaxID=300112 RepID=A0A4S2L4Q1_9HYME|nr:hypothetical protein DBV15_08319 [Temnothorax longispinosus]